MGPKSRAEIQRAYRARQKEKNNDDYLRRERERKREKYIPREQLGRRDKLRIQVKTLELVKKHREAKRKEREPAADPDPPLTIKMSFPSKSKGSKKRVSRAYGRKCYELSKVKDEMSLLKKRYKTAMRKLQRRQRLQQENPGTPLSKTNAILEEAGISREQAERVKGKLLLSTVVMEEVKKTATDNKRSKRNVLHNILAGRIVKKYRCMTQLSRDSGLGRRALMKSSSKKLDSDKHGRRRKIAAYAKDVSTFYTRDDNSRVLPGKADKVKIAKETTEQKRVLTDYLANLYDKYMGENPNATLSLTSFQRMRPKNVLLTCFITRDNCLCTKHQNMALLVKSLQREGLDVSKNPQTFIENTTFEDVKAELQADEITYQEWRRVTVDDANGQKKLAMRVVEVKKERELFLAHFENYLDLFKEHVSRMKTQYAQIRSLKQQLPPHHAVIHMDFSENYQCKSSEEIQSAYWNTSFVTLHPAVVYTPSENDDQDIKHENIVYISDDLTHNASSVVTFVKDLNDRLKELDPDIEAVHYWTDSPTSQYRNKTIFYMTSLHQEMFGVRATWNYFEAGHGKGPCDGIGGSTKRNADQAIKSGKVLIQDARDFHAWTQGDDCNIKNIKFKFIPKEDCESTAKEVKEWPCKAVKGTMKAHAVVGRGGGTILLNDVSCYCQECLKGNYCDAWRVDKAVAEKKKTKKRPEETSEAAEHDVHDVHDVQEVPADVEAEQPQEQLSLGQYVGALYEGRCYIGNIIDKDMDDDLCYKISFLQQKKTQFQWPKHADELWCKKQDILFTVNDPVPSGKSKRLLKLAAEDMKKLENY